MALLLTKRFWIYNMEPIQISYSTTITDGKKVSDRIKVYLPRGPELGTAEIFYLDVSEIKPVAEALLKKLEEIK